MTGDALCFLVYFLLFHIKKTVENHLTDFKTH